MSEGALPSEKPWTEDVFMSIISRQWYGPCEPQTPTDNGMVNKRRVSLGNKFERSSFWGLQLPEQKIYIGSKHLHF